MCGIDKNDQLRQYYSIRTRGRKCHMYIAYFYIDVVITNSYIFHSLLSEPRFCNMKDFRLNLEIEIIGSYNSRKCAGRPSILSAKKFSRVISHRNQTTNLAYVTIAIRIKNKERYSMVLSRL